MKIVFLHIVVTLLFVGLENGAWQVYSNPIPGEQFSPVVDGFPDSGDLTEGDPGYVNVGRLLSRIEKPSAPGDVGKGNHGLDRLLLTRHDGGVLDKETPQKKQLNEGTHDNVDFKRLCTAYESVICALRYLSR